MKNIDLIIRLNFYLKSSNDFKYQGRNERKPSKMKGEMMKKEISLKTFMATVAFVCALLGIALPSHAAQFTADIAITGPGANYSYKLSVKDTMYRLEKVSGGMQIPPFPTIVNQDTGVTLCLNPQSLQYTETTKVEETMMMNPIVGWEWARKDWHGDGQRVRLHQVRLR